VNARRAIAAASGVWRGAARLWTRSVDALRHRQRPPILAIAFACDDGRAHLCHDVALAAKVALAQGHTSLHFMYLPPWYWHRDESSVPFSAWRPWRTLTTGEFLARVERTSARIGTYHTSGEASLVRQGYAPRDARALLAAQSGGQS